MKLDVALGAVIEPPTFAQQSYTLHTIQLEPSNKEYVLWSTLLKKSHYEPRRYEVGGQLLPSPHFILQLYAGYPLTAGWKYIGYPDIGNQARRAWIRQKG